MKALNLSVNAPENRLKEKDIVWCDAKNVPFMTYGVFYDSTEKMFLRVKREVLSGFDDVFRNLNANTAGGRLRFVTNSPYIALFVRQKNNIQLNIMTLCGQSGFDIYNEDGYLATFLPKTNAKNGFCDIVYTDGETREYTLNFPLFDNVSEIYIGLSADSEVLPPAPYKNEGAPVVFYGSSITEGACASRPGNTFAAIVCRELGLDYINLGFASRCGGEKETAEYISGLKMSALVIGFDHNAKTKEELNRRHYDFYKTVRKANKTLPIILVSAPDNPQKPAYSDRKEVVIATYERAKQAGDNVYFIDGAALYGDCASDATVDGVHPNDLGFYKIAKSIIPVLKSAIGE